MDSDRHAVSDALFLKLVADSKLVPVVRDAGADGPAQVFWVPAASVRRGA